MFHQTLTSQPNQKFIEINNNKKTTVNWERKRKRNGIHKKEKEIALKTNLREK